VLVPPLHVKTASLKLLPQTKLLLSLLLLLHMIYIHFPFQKVNAASTVDYICKDMEEKYY